MRFGAEIEREGYNLFALGPHGIGKQTLLRQFLDARAVNEPAPVDWCYVHNFRDPQRPRAVALPAGMAARLARSMERLVAELAASMPATFDSEEYRTRKQQLVKKFNDRVEKAFVEAQQRARQRDVAVVRTDTGILLSPLRDGEALESDRFQELPPEEQDRFQAAMERTGEDLSTLFGEQHDAEREHRQAQIALDREFAALVARRHVDDVRAHYRDSQQVADYLDEVERDVVENADDFLQAEEDGVEAAFRKVLGRRHPNGPSFVRYAVNVLVDNGGTQRPPVIHEDNPSYTNLIGRIDHVAEFGALISSLMLIRPGALHRAAGGYLLLEAAKVLQQPFGWEALKRALRCREIRIESADQMLGVASATSLEPEPIPLTRCKIVLFGPRTLYYLLAAHDPDFLELFKVIVDFEETMNRTTETQALYARVVAALVRKEGLRPFERGAVAGVLDHATRLSGDSQKLSVRMRPVVDVIREADFWAEKAGRTVATDVDVQKALDEQTRRASRLRDQLLEEIQRGTILIDTEGEKVGQLNALSIVRLGEYSFGYPTRITARVRLGTGEVVDIEREVEMGGPLHSKGVLEHGRVV